VDRIANIPGIVKCLAQIQPAITKSHEASVCELSALGGEFALAGESARRYSCDGQNMPRMPVQCRAHIVVLGATSRASLGHAFIDSNAKKLPESLPWHALVVKPTDFARHSPF
jgi:hypothetical protein